MKVINEIARSIYIQYMYTILGDYALNRMICDSGWSEPENGLNRFSAVRKIRGVHTYVQSLLFRIRNNVSPVPVPVEIENSRRFYLIVRECFAIILSQ